MADRFAHVPMPKGYAALPSAARAVWDALCFHQRWGKDAKPIPLGCFPSQAQIAATAGISDRTVRRGIVQLEKLGWIARVMSKFGSVIDSTHYVLLAAGQTMPEQPDKMTVAADKISGSTGQNVRGHRTKCPTNTTILTQPVTRPGEQGAPAPSNDEKREARMRAIREARTRQ